MGFGRSSPLCVLNYSLILAPFKAGKEGRIELPMTGPAADVGRMLAESIDYIAAHGRRPLSESIFYTASSIDRERWA